MQRDSYYVHGVTAQGVKMMKCYQCGGEYQDKRGCLQWMGSLAVDGVHYYECDSCEDLLLPPETMEILDSKRVKK